MKKILDNKPKIENVRDGVVIYDLLEPSYNLGIEKTEIDDFGYVTSQMTMRPDLFSGVYAQSEEEYVNILKFNRISNPFTLNEGDFLAIPNITDMEALFLTTAKRLESKPNVTGSKENIRNKVKEYLNPFTKENTPTNTFDAFKKKYERLEEQKRLEEAKKLQTGNSNDSSELLPPNFSDENRKEITTTPNGTVILGTSVADTATSCGKENVTKAELLNSLIKNRVINR